MSGNNLDAVPVVASEFQEALPGLPGGGRQGEGSLHVDGSLAETPLDAVVLIELVHLQL